MRLTVLGCSGTIGGADSPASSYLVEHDGFRVVLDLGSGALGALQRHLRPERVDAVILSHLHPDHFIDMTGLATYLRWAPGGPFATMSVIGPTESEARVAAAYGDGVEQAGVFEYQVPAAGPLGPFELSFVRVRHPITCHAVRLDAGGRSIVYSGDTGPSPELVELARDADVLLCEAALGPEDAPVPGLHLTGREAGEHAELAGVGRLVVTHVPPWHSRRRAAAEAARTFSGTVLAAEPDAIYDI